MTQDFKQDFYQQGLAKAKLGDRYGAVQAFSCAIAANSEFAEAYYQRGLVLFDLGDHQGAIEASANAAKWTKVSFWVSVAGIVLSILFVTLFGGLAVLNSFRN